MASHRRPKRPLTGPARTGWDGFLREALQRLGRIFGRAYCGDNTILLGKVLSFLDAPRFKGAILVTGRKQAALGLDRDGLVLTSSM